jgi:hypothetical protein
MDLDHWVDMVRTGESAWSAARRHLGDNPPWPEQPRWSFERFGMTRTRLPDGRIVCVAGEHEDHYDPDFCIYNDVVVIAPGADVTIYGYPETVFPPTDFHTATLADDRLIVVGRVGYPQKRARGPTPVCSLDLKTFAFTQLAPTGDAPGWIHGHHAELESDGRTVRVSGGEVPCRTDDGKERWARNDRVFRLDLDSAHWTAHEGHWLDPPPTDVAWPPAWRPIQSQKESRKVADGISRSVAPDHALFPDDYIAIAQTGDAALAALLRSRVRPRHYVVSEGPSWTGRVEEPLKFERYDDLDVWLRAAEGRSDWWWSR